MHITNLSKVENGLRYCQQASLRLLLQLYLITDESAIRTLEELNERLREPNWWTERTISGAISSWFERYVRLENDAVEVRSYDALCVPGLLQTLAYTQAISADPGMVQVRASRQQRLAPLHGDTPLTLHALIDESVLLRNIVTGRAMKEQLAHLRNATKRGNVKIRIVPLSSGVHPGLAGSFRILAFPDPSDNVAYVEGHDYAFYPDSKDAEPYERSFKELWRIALDDAASASFLAELEENYHAVD